MLKPRVSVVIPLYNKESTILRALDSVFIQDVPDIEIVVVDDGSTDGSADVVRGLADPRVRLISQANAGPGRARNVGASHATAPLLAFLDADDEWLPGYLEAGLAALDEYTECVAYVAGYDAGEMSQFAANRVAMVVDAPERRDPPRDASRERLLNCLDGMHSSSTIVRKSVFDLLGGFYQADRCLWGEDSFLWIKVLFSGPIFWDPVPRIRYHIEDSALGFAVKIRSKARPLSEQVGSILPTISPDCRNSFLSLAKEVAIDDAVAISSSGFLLRSFRLRIAHSDFRLRGYLGDLKRFLRSRLSLVMQSLVLNRHGRSGIST